MVCIEDGGIEGSKSWTIFDGDFSFCAMELGATLTKILIPTKAGKKIDVLLGYDTAEGFLNGNGSHGAIVGRVANRIKDARFELNGKIYDLVANDGKNCLHGGEFRFEKQIWNGRKIQNGVEFSRKSFSSEQGFPGDVEIRVCYTIPKKNTLKIEYFAKSNGDTPFAPTNHAYFNLNGSGTALNHELFLNCEKFAQAGENLIPTGKILSVKNTPLDFLTKKTVLKDIFALEGAPSFGFDHSFLTESNGKLKKVAELFGDKSGIKMTVSTDAPALHFYSGNFLDGVVGKNGTIHKKRDGLCFETGFLPNAVNEKNFPSPILKADEEFYSTTEFSFLNY